MFWLKYQLIITQLELEILCIYCDITQTVLDMLQYTQEVAHCMCYKITHIKGNVFENDKWELKPIT